MSLAPEKLNLQSTPLSEEKQNALKALVPEAFVTGELDLNTLLDALGLSDEDTHTQKETYGLNWAGKAEARRQASKPTHWTLAPAPEDSVDWDTTQNLLIEADNLVALKLLKKGYTGKIDLIYIDPPYNVDADTVYKDDYSENVKAYEQRSGKRDDAGNLLDTCKDKGHKHSQWLNMMTPRLQLLKQLLKMGGVICVSIDDTEVANLRLLMDEIFGEDNFVASVIWERAYSPVNLKRHFSESHDYLLFYSNNINSIVCNGLPRSDEANDRYSNPDNDPRGDWASSDLSVGPAIQSKIYEITTPNGRKVLPPSGYCWRLDKEKFEEYKQDNRIWFGDKDGNVPRIKRFLSEVKNSITPMTIWKYQDVGHSQSATQELKKLLSDTSVFDYPKPVGLLQRIQQLYSDKNAVILDCFAGSGTTGHAVMKLNAEDGGTRQYICVQLPEKLDPKNKNQATACDFLDGIEKPRTIAEITKERLRRAGAKIRQEHPDFNGDLGFKVFKQVPSQQLQATQGLDLTTTTESDLDALREAQIRNQQPSLPLESVNPLHLAYEVMLKRHTYPLTAPIERITFAGHEDCFRLGSEEGALCIFATEININAIIKGLIEILEHDDSAFPSAVYMLENAFHSAGEYNDFASALEQLSTHYNIGTGKAERGEQPTLKFYTL